MNNKKIISEIIRDLKKHIDIAYIEREKIYRPNIRNMLGVRVIIIRKIIKKHHSVIKNTELDLIFKLCDDLLKNGIWECKIIAFGFAYKSKKDFKPSHFKKFNQWVKSYLEDWSDCDDMCNHIIGEMIMMYPELIPEVKKWTTSRKWIVRRASAVAFVVPGRKGLFLNDILDTAKLLMNDNHYLVQKGYGWALKEASRQHQKEIFNFVIKNKKKMTGTAFRYSIEKMPDDMRQKAMLEPF